MRRQPSRVQVLAALGELARRHAHSAPPKNGSVAVAWPLHAVVLDKDSKDVDGKACSRYVLAPQHQGPSMSHLPAVLPRVEAGFPSPAADFAEESLDLVRLVVKRPAATFYWRVVGGSMTEAGIADGDLLVVDRSVSPQAGDIVVAVVGDGFSVKRLARKGTGWELQSEGDGPRIAIDPELGVEIWGVATWAFKELRR